MYFHWQSFDRTISCESRGCFVESAQSGSWDLCFCRGTNVRFVTIPINWDLCFCRGTDVRFVTIPISWDLCFCRGTDVRSVTIPISFVVGLDFFIFWMLLPLLWGCLSLFCGCSLASQAILAYNWIP